MTVFSMWLLCYYVYSCFQQSDLIYTFFHPMLRDEQGGNVKAPTSQVKTVSGRVKGEIKLSVHHKNNALYIMIMHCRNLVSIVTPASSSLPHF